MATYGEVLDLLPLAHQPADWRVRGATPRDIHELERSLSYPVPEELAEWLIECNGTPGGPGGLYGTGTLLPWLEISGYLEMFPEWRERCWIPIGGDGAGNYFVYSVNEPRSYVGFVEPAVDENEVQYWMATSLAIFLRELLRDEISETRWPFDRRYVASVDPGLLDVVPSPFEEECSW